MSTGESSTTAAFYLPYPHIGVTPTMRDRAVSNRVFGTRDIEPANLQKHAHILKPLCELCAEKGITNIPPVMIAKSPVQNASMTGSGTMIISDGLVETLNESEMRAIIMHELEHYQKKEMTSVIAHALGFIVDFAVGIFGGNKIDKMIKSNILNPYVQHAATHVLPGLATHYIVVAPAHAYFQRKGEYAADLEGATTVGFDNMIGVLKYFDELYENKHKAIPTSIVTRIKDKGMMGNIADVVFPFADHPTFKERIAHLEEARKSHPETHVSALEM